MSSHTVMLSGETLSERQARLSATPSDQLRQRPRVSFERSVLAIPLDPDGGPDWEHRFTGRSIDIGLEGIGLEFHRAANLQTLGLVLTLSAEPGSSPACLGVDISNPQDLEKERCRIGGHFSGF